MISLVKRTITRTMTEEGKKALRNLVRTNDFTLSTRGKESRKVFKFSKQKFAEMELEKYGILVGQDGDKGYILVVDIETEGAVLKGTKGKQKNQEFTYNDLVDILNPTEDRCGYDLVKQDTVIDGVVSVWEIQPTELVRKASASSEVIEDEDEDEEIEDESNEELEEAEETWN